MEKKRLYVGIDLGYERAMVSLYHTGMKEPDTASTVAGEERYQIPAAIFVGNGGDYHYGDEAVKRENRHDGDFYEQLYREALREEHALLYHNYLTQFFKKLICYKDKHGFGDMPYSVAVAVPEVTPRAVEVLQYVRDELEIEPEDFLILDYGESFFMHTYHQERSIWQHDAALFDFSGSTIRATLLHREPVGTAWGVKPVRREWEIPAHVRLDSREKDEFFAKILREAFLKRIVSAVYFIGDGFDGGWLQESLRAVGPNRRIFVGKNLYTRGACLAAFRRDHGEDWHFFYDAAYKMQGVIGVKLIRNGKPVILPLAEAGENWFDVRKSLRILYDGDPDLEIRVQRRGERYASVQKLKLEHIPERPFKTVRLALHAVPDSGTGILLQIRDDGFGELFAATKREWNFRISIEEQG